MGFLCLPFSSRLKWKFIGEIVLIGGVLFITFLTHFPTVLCVWIRFRMFLGHQDPDPSLFVRIRIFTYQAKKYEIETLVSTVLWLLYKFLSLKNDVNVPSKKEKKILRKNNLFLVDIVKATEEKSRIRSRIQIRIRICNNTVGLGSVQYRVYVWQFYCFWIRIRFANADPDSGKRNQCWSASGTLPQTFLNRADTFFENFISVFLLFYILQDPGCHFAAASEYGKVARDVGKKYHLRKVFYFIQNLNNIFPKK